MRTKHFGRKRRRGGSLTFGRFLQKAGAGTRRVRLVRTATLAMPLCCQGAARTQSGVPTAASCCTTPRRRRRVNNLEQLLPFGRPSGHHSRRGYLTVTGHAVFSAEGATFR